VGRRRIFWQAAGAFWGLLLACWLARGFFLHPANTIYENHEAGTYVGRLLEFRDLLAAGYYWPQWCTDFRAGLGSPYFSYYQPGFFYLASLVPWSLAPIRALGIAVMACALAGYLAMWALIGRRFGTLGGWVAASGLLLSSYVGTEIYLRGDLSELAAMMGACVAVWALQRWLDSGGWPKLACLAAAGAGLILLHPCVALIGYGVMALGVALFYWQTGQLGRALGALAGLVFGAGLAAFYWFPVFFEWHLVGSDAAFSGFYHYSRHFVSPLALLGPYDRRETVPVSLGPILPLLAAFNVLVLARRRGEATAEQWRLVTFCAASWVVCVLLMSPGSALVWRYAPLLHRLQFPWRILSVLTVLTAALAGAVLPWRRAEYRTAAMAALVLAMFAFSWQYTAYRLDRTVRLPQDAAALQVGFFAPDLCHEWLPRGAQIDISMQDAASPVAGEGCEVRDFQRRQGRLSCRVRARADSFVILPHYYFPVGFRATLSGRTLAIQPDNRGLMKIDLPAESEGVLEVTFSQTPMRTWGLIASAGCLAALLGLCLVYGRAERARAGSSGADCSERPCCPLES